MSRLHEVGRLCVAAGLFLAVGDAGAGSSAAVIQDPDGYTNVRSDPDKSARVVGAIKDKQRFIAISDDAEWWEVFTPSGGRGFVHKSRVKLLPSEPLPRLAFSREGVLKSVSDTPEFSGLGFDYGALVRKALDGGSAGLRRFYDLSTSASLDGAAAEGHNALVWEVFHAVGDESFSSFLSQQDEAFRRRVGDELRNPFVTWPVETPDSYLRRHFPKTWNRIGSSERVSPDGR